MPHKLLLADDSITIQRVIELTFADEDVKVAAVGDGQQAIDRIEADPPDIILADVGMPKRDGYDVAAYVKSRPALAHIPVVLLTGAFEPVDQARAAAVGCDGVLAKPFEPHMVISRVKQLLKGVGASAPARPGAAAPAPPQAAGSAPAAAEVRPPEVERSASAHAIDPATILSSDELGPKGKTTDTPVSLDDYFDQLDAAFSNLDASPRANAAQDLLPATPTAGNPDDFNWAPKPPPGAREVEKPDGLKRTAGAGPNEFEWIAAHAGEGSGSKTLDFSGVADIEAKPVAAAAAPVVLTSGPVAPAVAQPTPVPNAPAAPRGPVVASADRQPKPKAAEEPQLVVAESPRPMVTVPMADAFVALLAAEQGETLAIPGVFAPIPTAGPIAITDELIERVSERVLNRLSDPVVRETVRNTVSTVAERLVREEIERIKRTGRMGD